VKQNVLPCILVSQLVFLILLPGCIISDPFIPVINPPFNFNIINKTGADLSVRLRIGEIPSPGAAWEEFVPYADDDEVFLFEDERWFFKGQVLDRNIPAGEDGGVYTCLPLYNLDYWVEHSQDFSKLKDRLFNKIISFTLTISRGEETGYTIAGWDIPKENTFIHNIDETLYGYYDTAADNWNSADDDTTLPLFYTKFLEDKPAYWPKKAPVYSITVYSPDPVELETEFAHNIGYWVERGALF
jgi:hypothetical protein